MKRILFVEDEADFRASFGKTLHAKDSAVALQDVESFKMHNGAPIEELFAEWVRKLEAEGGNISGALLDTDLSTNLQGVSQSLAREALHSIGIPACRYSKKGKAPESEHLRRLKLRMTEGAQAVPFPSAMSLAEQPEESAAWVLELFRSFEGLSLLVQKYLSAGNGPAAILAQALGEPDSEVDFATYREAYQFYFADLLEPQQDPLAVRRLCTQVGYWFVNCILAFPGPILNAGAAAAVLGLDDKTQLQHKSIEALLKSCRYEGPFQGHGPYFWRSKILDQLDDEKVLDQLTAAYKELKIDRPVGQLRYCLILDRPLKVNEVPTRPDWIPAGAVESFVERKTYNRLNPWIQTSGKKNDV